ncbi:hypothetical protein GGX14DRAFT_554249 [Mycena pura]|uniref:Uncharacterized protein n=1 Tax=Mycena pura TaxID=153505 RepID=A0AAD6YS29_9AGAR|nr:hypothetical protein GGX14DRAFT_554249 [Mycena pura]
MALLNFIYNRPNRVLALQKQYQVTLVAAHADARPIYLRPAGAKPTLMVYGAIFSVAMMSTMYGIGCLVTGYGKPSAAQSE